jgi:hypothetical protein
MAKCGSAELQISMLIYLVLPTKRLSLNGGRADRADLGQHCSWHPGYGGGEQLVYITCSQNIPQLRCRLWVSA